MIELMVTLSLALPMILMVGVAPPSVSVLPLKM
jgi:hypothetical protein